MTVLTINMIPAGAADTTPPSLSALAASKVGSFGWLGSVGTDEANGTLFYRATQNATETAAAVKAGSSQPVTQTGTQALSGAGISPATTYYLHVLHRDAAGNDSPVLSSNAFTTDALGSGSGTVTIQVLRRGALQVAPEGVFFRASVSDASVTQAANRFDYDPSAHLCAYLWTFGDPGRQSNKVTNVPLVHNDLNTGRGKEVGHTFITPGSYTITCQVYGPNGYIGTDSVQVAVGDPDTVFAGDRTILVNAAGQADPAHSGATVVTTIDAAKTLSNSRATAHRILFKRGETFTLSSTFLGLGAADDNPNFYLGAYGTGNRPILRRTNGPFVQTGTAFTGDFVMTGLDLRGGWNSLNETGNTDEFIRLYTYSTPRMHVLDDCVVDGGFMAVYLPGSNASAGNVCSTHVCNSSFTGWGDYVLYSGNGMDEAVSVEGCAFIRKGLAWEGGSNAFSTGNSQGCVRIGDRMRANFRVCDMFSKCSWTVLDGIPGQQPCLRFNTNGNAGHYSHVDRCSFEGGANCITYGVNGSSAVQSNNSIVERSLLVGTPMTEAFFAFEGTGQTVRNNIMHIPNAKRFRDWKSVFTWGTNPPGDPDDPVNLYSNTIIIELNDTNRNGADLTRYFTGPTGDYNAIVEDNNVIWAPNATGQGLTDPQFTGADMTTVGGTWMPRYIGHIWSGKRTLDVSYASPGGFMKEFRPDIGSQLIRASSGLSPYDDFYGTVRGANTDGGAVER